MPPQIILSPSNKYTVLDEGRVLLEDVTQTEVEKYFIEEFRRRFWQMAQARKVDWLEHEVITGKVKCCDCGETVTKYNSTWKKENQRCEKCKR